jgi:hypothetical protein
LANYPAPFVQHPPKYARNLKCLTKDVFLSFIYTGNIKDVLVDGGCDE